MSSISRILQLAGVSRIDESEKPEVAIKEGGFGFLRSLQESKKSAKPELKKKTNFPKQKNNLKENWQVQARHEGWDRKCEKIARLFNTKPQIVWEVKNHAHNLETDGHVPHGVIGKAIAEYITQQNEQVDEPAKASPLNHWFYAHLSDHLNSLRGQP